MLQQILDKYPEEPFPKDRQQRIAAAVEPYRQLREKWAEKVPPAWYGFDLYDVPLRWLRIIDEFLDYLADEDPDLEIHQIKLKYGGLRFYVNCDSRFRDQITLLENTLYNSGLIH